MNPRAPPAAVEAAACPDPAHVRDATPAHPSQGSRARRGPLGTLALIERAHAASTPRFVSSVLVLGAVCVGLVSLATCTQP